jgi:hypothetical protein
MASGKPMHYVDLALSFVLSVLGVLSLVLRKLKTNVWVSVLSLLLFPLAVFSYYFPQLDRVLFGSISVQDAIMYPFVKVLILFALAAQAVGRKKAAKEKHTP